MRYALGSVWLSGVLLLVACSGSHEESVAASKRALIIVDMQYDFLPGGSLPTAGGDEIVELINTLQGQFDLVVATQDWHPPDHGSFASQHPDRQPGEVIDLHGLQQVLWPDHAVHGSRGAEMVGELERSDIDKVFQKGTNPTVDSYSGFFDNGQRGDTGLNNYLESHGVTDVYVVWLALDYCDKFTALDANRVGYSTWLIEDASRAVNLRPNDGSDAVKGMQAAGVQVIRSEDLLEASR